MNQFTGAIARFGIGRLVAILGISAGVAAALFALTMNLGEPKALLYSNLDLKEAGAITQALDQAGVKYEAKGDGSTIMVPRDEVASTRLMLSSKGLPTAGSVGYEIFDDANALGQTDMVQQMNRQRALEGELARTIGSMEGITSTRVHLALPKRQLFEEESEPPTASVSLTVGGRDLDSQQVRAIQNLVAGAVPDMKPANVAVVDQHARTLSTPNDGMEAATGRKNEVEARIESQVRKLIEGIVGPGKARVNVTADLDLARVTVQQETFDPDGQVVRSESTTEEKAAERTSDGNGVASVAANIPPGAETGAAGNSSNNDRTESTTNFEISKTTRTEIKEPGEVKKLAVAVAVDGVTAVGKDGKPGAFTPRSAEEIARIEQLVRTAVGYNQERGDQVTVVAAKFTSVSDESGGVTASNPLMGFDKNDIMRAAELGILAIVAVLMMIFIVRPLLRGASQGPAPMAMGGSGMAQMGPGGGGQQMMTVDPSTGQPLALMGPSEVESKIDIARIEGQVKASSVKRVSEFVEKHPEESVSILRSWVHDTA